MMDTVGMKVIAVLLLLCTAFPLYVMAQDGPTSAKEAVADKGDAKAADDDAEAGEEGDAAEGAEASQPPVPLEGDTVVFVSGKELRGVHVIRESALFVEIEYLPGEPLLKLPRTQVAQIIYEKDAETAAAAPEVAEIPLSPDIMPGKEVSPEFHRMLTTPLSDQLNFDNADYLVVLKEFAAQTGVTLDVAPELEAIPVEERKFTRNLPAGTTLMSFLRMDLAEIAPDARVILQFDKLVLQKRVEPAAEDAPTSASAPASAAEGAAEETAAPAPAQ